MFTTRSDAFTLVSRAMLQLHPLFEDGVLICSSWCVQSFVIPNSNCQCKCERKYADLVYSLMNVKFTLLLSCVHIFCAFCGLFH